MLRVPRIRQPNRVTVLPAFLRVSGPSCNYHGFSIELDEIIDACRLDSRGAVQEIALQGLREAGWEVGSLRAFDMDEVSAALAEDRPLIISLERHEWLAHAVVVCAIDNETVTVMDPLEGEYAELPLGEVLLQMEQGLAGTFYVAGVDLESLEQ